MAQFSHVYTILSGAFRSGTPWAGEYAQIGMRLAVWPGITTPDVDGLLPLREATSQYELVDTTNLSGSIGFTGEGEYWTEDMQLALAESWRAWANAVRSENVSTFDYTGVKITPIGPDGKAATNPTVLSFKTKIAGTDSTGEPPQASIAISFRAVVPGRRGRGRFYFPALGGTGTLDASGRPAAGVITTLGNATRAMVTNIESLGDPGVNTRLVVTSAGNPRYVLPNEIRIGNHIDTQRRRRAQVPETYTTF